MGVYALVVLLLAAGCRKNKDNGSKDTKITADSLSRLVGNIRAKSEMPGLYVAVIKNGKVDFSSGYGYADSNQKLELRKLVWSDKNYEKAISLAGKILSLDYTNMEAQYLLTQIYGGTGNSTRQAGIRNCDFFTFVLYYRKQKRYAIHFESDAVRFPASCSSLQQQ